MSVERFQTVVVGGGQSGLAAGYQLRKRGLPFVILDANERTGHAWRERWDSLRLFTPPRYGLKGMRIPVDGRLAPTKDDMADYLEVYAERFELPVRHGVKVDGIAKAGGRFVVRAGDQTFEAGNVIVATGAFQNPFTPAFAGQLDPSIVQVHSRRFRNPSQLRDGGVLLVGAGNSGADIAMEVSKTHPTWLAGRHPGNIPFRIDNPFARQVLIRMVRFMGQHVLTRRTPLGRKIIRKLEQGGDPVVRVKPKDLEEAGVERVARVAGVRDGLPLLEDGRVLDVTNVIWSTGFRQDFSWVDLPVVEDGKLIHRRGIVDREPGLYFVGLEFQFSPTSDTITGVGRDAAYIVKHLASRKRTSPKVTAQRDAAGSRVG